MLYIAVVGVFVGVVVGCNSIDDLANHIVALMQVMDENENVLVRVQQNVRQKMAQQQKEWFITEQIRQLQDELDGDSAGASEPDQLLKKIKAKKFSPAIAEKLEDEIERMRMMQPTSPEYAVSRNYVDWFLNLPYGVYTDTVLNMKKVKSELDSKHFGLDKVKERIMEYVAVLKLTGTERRSPILCLVGPPGVGKTTLVESIANAMQRNFVRITLGGVRDEAEIRGHRRTYIGAMPGRFIHALRRAKCMNPIILLDEIDKMASDFRGDPASAMLEVLDPEQNHDFTDHFMEVGLDLSRVLFIATANSESEIPEALRDRLEIVRLPGYYPHEKLQIASKYLLPRICERTGVKLDEQVSFDEKMVTEVMRGWTREAGVRELERTLENVVRHRAKEIVMGKKFKPEITEKQLQEYLGAPRFLDSQLPEPGRPGIVTGLAWTSVGGEILPIECMLLSGKGQIIMTGKLGDVMNVPPKMDEEFCKQIGVKDEEDLKNNVAESLANRKRDAAKAKAVDEAIDKIIEQNPFDVPHARVVDLIKWSINRNVQDPKDAVEPTEEQINGLSAEAIREIKKHRILDFVANKEKLKASQESVDERLKMMAQAYQVDFETLKGHFRQSGRINGLREELRMQMAADFIVGIRPAAESK